MKKFILFIAILIILFIFSCKKDDNTKVIIYRSSSAQTEIISPQGIRILIDIVSTRTLSSPVNFDNDILLTTHSHGDHVNQVFKDSFKGTSLYACEGKIKKKDVEITGISSLHGSQGKFQKSYGSNYIYLIKIGNIKIAHFGDIGQDKFTGSQLSKLKNLDVAITQFTNSWSGMDFNNKKGFKQMDQIKPKIIIPTSHINKDTSGYALTIYNTYYKDNPLTVDKNLFEKNKAKFIYIGEESKKQIEDFNIKNL